MIDREKIIYETLCEQYPEIDKTAHLAMAEYIDVHWHILKKKALDGESGDWTLSGQIQSVIWDTYGGGAQSSTVAYKILRKMSEEGLK